MATNRERAVLMCLSLGATREQAEQKADEMVAAKIIAPDPEPRYKLGDALGHRAGRVVYRGTDVPLTFTEKSTSEERAAVLAALNALDEADRG